MNDFVPIKFYEYLSWFINAPFTSGIHVIQKQKSETPVYLFF